MPITPPSASSTGLSGGGCAPSCASRKSAQGGASAAPTINAGQMPSSRKPGCSRFTRPGYRRDSLDEETTDWRAVCEKTARTVRREGSAKADPYPYRRGAAGSAQRFTLLSKTPSTQASSITGQNLLIDGGAFPDLL